MKLGELPRAELLALAARGALHYRSGPFTIKLRSQIGDFVDTLADSYAATDLLPQDEPSHYRINMRPVSGWRQWLRPQVQFAVDDMVPFEPYPLDHAFPMYEWGVNWCIGTTGHTYLILHSAVVEKNGQGVILPAVPGSGKSTLCAGLVSRGWRLLSDEFAIIRHADCMLMPVPRAAPLKNESIDIIRQYAPHLDLGPRYDRTRKGTVVHMRPPAGDLQRQHEPVRPRWVIFPHYAPGQQTRLVPQGRGMALTKLSNNSFNYQVTMEAGFRTLVDVVRGSDCYELPNGDLDEAVSAVESLLVESVG